MTEPFVGEIMMCGFNYPPYQWAWCDGTLLPIQQNTALYSLLGTYYGGNGTTTFALPDLRGRAPTGPGQGPGLTLRTIGEQGGSELVTLIGNELPTHTHQARVSTADGTQNSPSGGYWAPWSDTPYVAGAVSRVAMHPAAINPLPGSGQPHENRSPFLTVGFAIALYGVYPSFQ